MKVTYFQILFHITYKDMFSFCLQHYQLLILNDFLQLSLQPFDPGPVLGLPPIPILLSEMNPALR